MLCPTFVGKNFGSFYFKGGVKKNPNRIPKNKGADRIALPWGIGLYRNSYRSTIDSLILSELPRNSGAYMAAAVVGRAM
jgi:hypothetical protein